MKFVRKVQVAMSDTRGRISLRKYTDNSLHVVDVAGDGVITLTPVVIMPREAAEKTDESIENPLTGVRVMRPIRRFGVDDVTVGAQ